MAKLAIFYKKHDGRVVGNILKIKVDDNETFEVAENKVLNIELTEGVHNIKMYYDGMFEGQIYGYIDTNIEANGDIYYIYCPNKVMPSKAKFKKCNITNDESFNKYVNKSNITHKIIGFIIIVIFLLMICFGLFY